MIYIYILIHAWGKNLGNKLKVEAYLILIRFAIVVIVLLYNIFIISFEL